MLMASHEFEGVTPEQNTALEQARAALAAGQFELAKTRTDEVLLASPTSWEAHFLAGKVAVAAKDCDNAVWHAFLTLVYIPEQSFADRVLLEIVDPVEEIAPGGVTKHLLHGLVAGMNGKLDLALQEFRESLAKAEARADRIRALQFLVLITSELGSHEASLGYAEELVKSDPDNYLAHLWRSDALFQLKRFEEAYVEREEANRLLEAFEDAAHMELGHAVTAHEMPQQLTKGDLRHWLTESTAANLAPMRAMLLANPGKSSIWCFLVDQLFHFDDIFGPSQSLLDAQLLEQVVSDAVSAKRIKESIPLPHPIRNPFGAEDAELATSLTIDKIMESNARPALVQLFDAGGNALWPRFMWKKGDDLRRDLTAMVFFEVFNTIWSNVLPPGGLFKPVLTYGVLPLKGRVGFVEWIEDTTTQQEFDWHRGNPKDWLASFAVSMTAAYCIGAEDRHSRNVLVAERDNVKQVFHIDFGYLWGVVPGKGLGGGPALPFSKEVSLALTDLQRDQFRDFAYVLYDALSLYRTELAGLAARFSEVVQLEVPFAVNVKSFMTRRLGSITMFKQVMRDSERDRGRLRKEYMALAWSRKRLNPKELKQSERLWIEFFLCLTRFAVLKSKTFDDSDLLQLIDPELLKQSIMERPHLNDIAAKLKKSIAKGVGLM